MAAMQQVFDYTRTYKGGVGQISWILHRLAGLGIFAFLALHIFDIFLVGFDPYYFETLAVLYHHPVMRFGHIGLFFCVLFHAINGIRIIVLDFVPELWESQKASVTFAWAVFAVLFLASSSFIIWDTFIRAQAH
jgi:succinate dehydrogenase / fumarate reductase cytochrome b subunit